MIRRRIEGLYGSGAARIALCSEAFHVGDPDDSLRRAGELFVKDLRDLGFRRALGLGGAPVVALVLLVMYVAASALVRPVHEASDIELVPFEGLVLHVLATAVEDAEAASEVPERPAEIGSLELFQVVLQPGEGDVVRGLFEDAEFADHGADAAILQVLPDADSLVPELLGVVLFRGGEGAFGDEGQGCG